MKLDKIEISQINKAIKERIDLFICSSSYEKRSLSISLSIDKNNIGKALILSNIDLRDHVSANKEILEDIFSKKNQVVDVCTTNPLLTADNIGENIDEVIDGEFDGYIVVDITTFTHESLLILLRILKNNYPKAVIDCVYSNATEYSIGDDVKHKWLSRGIGEVRSVLGYPGVIVPSRDTHLILVVGYEHERAAGLVDALEPNTLSIGFGRSGSATTDKNKDANETYMQLVEQMATSFYEVNTFEISCNDPIGAKNELISQINKFDYKNIIIAPMNNKLSTIGAALAAFENQHVQMCYAQALRYNYLNYSTPGKHCYIFRLDLGGGE